MIEVHVLRVFCDAAGGFGNPLGVVLDTNGLSDERRQAIAAQLGFSETVFVEDVEQAQLRIFTPTRELPLAGHPLVGASWLLTQTGGRQVETLRPLRAANVETWTADGVTWIRARIADAPEWGLVQLERPEQIDALAVPPAPQHDLHEFWAWRDEAAGEIRARVFASRYGIAEDQATGSGALRLVDFLQRPIVIHQGLGSVIHARPAAGGRGDIGGHVAQDEVRSI